MKAALFTCTVILLGPLAIRGQEPTHDALAEESLKALDKASDILAAVKDKKSVDDARAKFPEIAKTLGELKKKLTAAGDPTKEQRAELDKKFKTKFEVAIKKFRDEAVRIATSVEGGK